MKNRVSPSLRIAFWTSITASSLFWIATIFLLSSCSGSIFSSKKDEEKKSADGNPAGRVVDERPAPVVERDDRDGDERKRVEIKTDERDTGHPDRSGPHGARRAEIVTGDQPVDRVGPAPVRTERLEIPSVRDLTLPLNLKVYPLFFNTLVEGKTDNQLDQLYMQFVIPKARRGDEKNRNDNFVRTITINMLEDKNPNGHEPRLVKLAGRDLSVEILRDDFDPRTQERTIAAKGQLGRGRTDRTIVTFHLYFVNGAAIKTQIVRAAPDKTLTTFPLEESKKHFSFTLE